MSTPSWEYIPPGAPIPPTASAPATPPPAVGVPPPSSEALAFFGLTPERWSALAGRIDQAVRDGPPGWMRWIITLGSLYSLYLSIRKARKNN